MISARMTWKVKGWRCPECFLYFDLSSLNLSQGAKHLVMKDKRGERRSSWAKDKAGLYSTHPPRARARASSREKERGDNNRALSVTDWGLQESSQGSCFRRQARPRTRSGKINRYGLARQMSYLPRTGQLLTFNINVHPSLFPIAHPVGFHGRSYCQTEL